MVTLAASLCDSCVVEWVFQVNRTVSGIGFVGFGWEDETGKHGASSRNLLGLISQPGPVRQLIMSTS